MAEQAIDQYSVQDGEDFNCILFFKTFDNSGNSKHFWTFLDISGQLRTILNYS